MKISQFKDGSWGMLSVLLAAIPMLLGGLWGSWACVVQPLSMAWVSRDWVETPAVLDEVWIQGTGGTWYPPAREGKINPEARMAAMPYGQVMLQVRYHYVIGEQVYESTDYGLHRILADGDRVRQAAALMYRRQVVRAWVNPVAPDQAVLDRQLHWSMILFGLPAGAMAILGLGLLWACLSALFPNIKRHQP